MKYNKKIGLLFVLIAVLGMVALANATHIPGTDVNVVITTDKTTYAVGDTINVEVKMDGANSPVRDTRLEVTSTTMATFVANSGTLGTFFTLGLGTSPTNNVASGIWTFYSGAGTPIVTSTGQQVVFSFKMTAVSAGSLTLSIGSGSSILQAVGPPPALHKTNHVVKSTPLTITITAAGGASPCTATDWEAGAWGACSVPCGSGTQSRTVNKKAGSETCTGDTEKPALTQNCNVEITKTCTTAGVSGTQTCANGAWGDCVAGCVESAEVCDGVDNDCDRTVDEGFNLQNDPVNCGACGTVCPSPTTCSDGDCTEPVPETTTPDAKTTFITQMDAFYEKAKGQTWTITLVSEAARILKSVFR